MELTKEQIKNMQEGLSNPVPWDSYVYATAVSNLLDTIAARDAEIADLQRENHKLKLNLAEPTIQLRIDRATATLRGRMEALAENVREQALEQIIGDDDISVEIRERIQSMSLAALDAPLETGKPAGAKNE